MNNTDKAEPTQINEPLQHPRLNESAFSAADSPESSLSKAPASWARQTVYFQFLLLAAGGLILAYLVFAMHQFFNAQNVFEAVQQQRILNQRYAKEVLLSASGVPVNYQKTSREWDRLAHVLAQGGVVRAAENQAGTQIKAAPAVPGYRETLNQMEAKRGQILQEASSYLDASRQIQHREQLFQELYRQSLELQAAGDALVQTYDKHLDSGVSWWDVNAVAVELAERQKMLIQQHIKEVLFVAHGIPADYQATRLRLYESVKILSEGGQIPVEGGEAITVPAPASSDVRFNVEQQKNALDRFAAVSNQYLMMSNEDVERSIQLKRIQDLTGEYHEMATGLLNQYRSLFEERVRRATRDAGTAALVTALFIVLLSWSFAKKFVDGPAAQISEWLKKLRSGENSSQGDIPQDAELQGPLRETGEQVKDLARRLQNREDWFDRFLTTDNPERLEDPGSGDPVASRVYQWYRMRKSSSPEARWSSGDGEESDVTIIGRLPDGEPTVNDADLLDQLIQKANELQGEHDEVLRARDRLAHEARELRVSEAGLSAEVERLRSEKEDMASQLAERAAELRIMRDRLREIQKGESVITASADEMRRVNAELLSSLDRQSDELRILKGDLRNKTRELESLTRDSRRRDEMNDAKIAELSQKLAAVEAQRKRLDAELTLLARTHHEQELAGTKLLNRMRTEKNAEIEQFESEHALRLQSLHQEHAGALEAQRLEHEGALEAKRLEHAQALEAQRVELTGALDALRREHAAALETLRAERDRTHHQEEEINRQIESLREERNAFDRELALREEAISRLTKALEEAELGASELRASLERFSIEAQQDSAVREQLTQNVSALTGQKADLEQVLSEQLRQIHRQEWVIAELQSSLARQTRALEALRAELSEAVARHDAESNRRDQLVAGLEAESRQHQAQLFETQGQLLDARSRLVETKAALETRESDLWQIRKELSERQREMSELRLEMERARTTEIQHVSAISDLKSETARMQSLITSKTLALNELDEKRRFLESKIAQLESEHAQVLQKLEIELTQSRQAHANKSQALTLTEERLTATRSALKSALDELQERSAH